MEQTLQARAVGNDSSGAGEAQSLPGRKVAPRPESSRSPHERHLEPELRWCADVPGFFGEES